MFVYIYFLSVKTVILPNAFKSVLLEDDKALFLWKKESWLNSLVPRVVLLYVNSRNPLKTSSPTKLSKHLQATGKQPIHVEGNLIVRVRLQFGMHGLSNLFSLKAWKRRHPWRQSGIPGSLLLRMSSLQSTAHLKHVRYTPGWSNSSYQDLVIGFQRLFYTNHEFENRTFDWVRLIFFSFRWVRFRSIAELSRTQSMNWVQLSSIEFVWNSVGLGSMYYAGI